jgi:hypothetical protein
MNGFDIVNDASGIIPFTGPDASATAARTAATTSAKSAAGKQVVGIGFLLGTVGMGLLFGIVGFAATAM